MTTQPPTFGAITLWPEWAWAITALGKDVENRNWPRPAFALAGRWLAIHAGKRVGGGQLAAEQALSLVLQTAGDGATLARAITAEDIPTSAIVAVVRVGEVGYGLPSRWSAEGAWQMGFADVLILPRPVPCAGRQGVWTLPHGVLRAVQAQWGDARHERHRHGRE